MNIFYLDYDPGASARALHDRHVVKMTLETAQILSTVAVDLAHRPGLILPRVYKPTHGKHPCVVWARESFANWDWLVRHGEALAEEYTYRWGKTHASGEVIQGLAKWGEGNALLWREWRSTDPAQAMPEAYRNPEDPVGAYRTYYRREKAGLSRWTKREQPDWLVKEASWHS